MPDLITRFTCGDCHQLARVIHEATGWTMATFREPDWDEPRVYDDRTGAYKPRKGVGDTPYVHAFIKLPNGLYLDVEGVRDEPAMLKRWNFAPGSIITWPTVEALREASDIWVDHLAWPDTPAIAQATAYDLIWKANSYRPQLQLTGGTT